MAKLMELETELLAGKMVYRESQPVRLVRLLLPELKASETVFMWHFRVNLDFAGYGMSLEDFRADDWNVDTQ